MALVTINTKSKLDYSNEYYNIHSVQKLNSEFDTNVFTSSIPVSQLLKNRDILLVDDLKGDARWGMNKIIQRNISVKRVEEIKDEYLEANNRAIKFFPAITVVLLPKTNGEPNQEYLQAEEDFDCIKGIIVTKTYEGEDFIYNYPTVIKWDKNEISALIIDGQHRVSAIRSYYDKKNESSYANVSIPVTFVVFKNDEKIDLIQATRALFIDVNNTPRLVSEEKLIFIDDRNIHRRITAKALGANDPGEENKDFYQQMLLKDDFMISNNDFINRYLIEESGKDDEENRGFLSNHKTLFPWEISNIMTIHRNILGSILLKFKDVDKTRDIRSICHELNNTILEEIELAESVEEFSISKIKHLIERLSNSGITHSELEIFKSLILLKKKNLEEIQQAQGEFFIGTAADPQEENDRKEFIGLLQNVYNQDCSKDSAFELSANIVSEILRETCFVYVKILTKVFNELWFTQQIKNSILKYNGEDRQLIFNFILTTHESLKLENNIRRRADKVEKQINNFLKENDNGPSSRINILSEWAKNLEESQKSNLLRTVVGQEMLFLFIAEQGTKLNLIELDEIIKFVNKLGEINFFDSSYSLELNFFGNANFNIREFNQWSEIIMKGESMKPGITNAMKGSNLITALKKSITTRDNAGTNLRLLDRLQKSYGADVLLKIANDDVKKRFAMYKAVKSYSELKLYLNSSEIEALEEPFINGESLTPKVLNIVSKVYGALTLKQVVNHFNDSL